MTWTASWLWTTLFFVSILASRTPRLSKPKEGRAGEAEELEQRRRVSQETAAMQKTVTGLLRVGMLIECKPGHYASVTVMTLKRNLERGEATSRRVEAALGLDPNSTFIFPGYDFKPSENYIPNTVEGRQALWDGLAWKLLPHLLHHSVYEPAQWHIVCEDDCLPRISGERVHVFCELLVGSLLVPASHTHYVSFSAGICWLLSAAEDRAAVLFFHCDACTWRKQLKRPGKVTGASPSSHPSPIFELTSSWS